MMMEVKLVQEVRAVMELVGLEMGLEMVQVVMEDPAVETVQEMLGLETQETQETLETQESLEMTDPEMAEMTEVEDLVVGSQVACSLVHPCPGLQPRRQMISIR